MKMTLQVETSSGTDYVEVNTATAKSGEASPFLRAHLQLHSISSAPTALLISTSTASTAPSRGYRLQ